MRKNLLYTIILFYSLIGRTQEVALDWVFQIGAQNQSAFGKKIALDSEGNIYVLGNLEGTVDFDPGVETVMLSSVGLSDVFISKYTPSGNFVWAKQFGTTFIDNGNDIAIDNNDNIYVCGNANNQIVLDTLTNSVDFLDLTNSGAFVFKINTDGVFQWFKQTAEVNSPNAFTIDADNTGHVYVGGYFLGTVDFNVGTGISALTSFGEADGFVWKMDLNGDFIWAKKMGGPSNDLVISIAVDNLENVYATGSFITNADFDPSSSQFNLVSNGGKDIFISKLDVLGNFVWVKQIGGTNYDEGNCLKVDSNEDVIITGRATQDIDFDPGSGVYYATTSSAFFVLKLNQNGDFMWVNTSVDGNVWLRNLTMGPDNFIYVNGDFIYSIATIVDGNVVAYSSPDNDNIFCMKIANSGENKWLKRIGSNDGFGSPRSLAVNQNDDIYTIGLFSETFDFDPNPGVYSLVAHLGQLEGQDLFLHKMSQNVVGIENELINNSSNKIYPNPSQENFTLEILTFSDIEIFDVFGRELKQLSLPNGKHLIDMDHLPSGIYFITINNKISSETIKWIKE